MTKEPKLPRTLGELKTAGWKHVGVRDEMRANLQRRLARREPLFPGVLGYDQTVVPQITNALLARQDFILLGLRGQAKTRLLRMLVALLDEWQPVIPGTDLHESPLAPVTRQGRERVAAAGDALELAWRHRDERYQEKLATPDVTIADLIGDVDPLKAARDRLALGSEEAVLYGILPRANRGIFAINELPDLAPRIQVGLLNVLEERDIQIRGFPVRLPLDVLLVFSANPEDYTNRGSIITPLKDRIAAQILTHYPADRATAARITAQEAWTARGSFEPHLPAWYRELVDEIAFQARRSELVDQSSGVSARLAIAALESIVSNVERRSLITGAPSAVRIIDLFAALPAITGKIELVYEGEQEGRAHVGLTLIGKAIQALFVERFPDAYAAPSAAPERGGARATRQPQRPAPEAPPASEYKPILDWFAAGNTLEISDLQPDSEYHAGLARVPGLAALASRHGQPADDRERAVWMELVLEGLCQRSLLGRDDLEGGARYGDLLGRMLQGLGKPGPRGESS